jgi:6,7-dimethyl-8-ribityllumazine synthase
MELDAMRVLIVEAPYYKHIAEKLAASAVAELDANGVAYDRLAVPGALEIPLAINAAVMQKAGHYDGAVALGCVIRGETTHYESVCDNTNHWLMQVAIGANLPLGNAVLTVENEAQALARTDKGAGAVRACLRLMEIQRDLAAKS